jgi:membrane protein DedA with SNARE-associated domain
MYQVLSIAVSGYRRAMESVFAWVATYGYVALFFLLVLGIVGLPIPDETLLVFSGYLISGGHLHPAGAFLTAMAGSWCGITLSYIIGRTLGLGFVHRFGKYIHITEARLAKVHQWFDRLGHWALFAGYFIAGVRHFTAIVAGTSKLEYRSFAAYAYSGGAVWSATFLTLGYFVGENWRKIAESLHEYVLYASIVLIAAVVVFVVFKKVVQARRGSA